jgi:hypothetical protein
MSRNILMNGLGSGPRKDNIFVSFITPIRYGPLEV